MTTCLGVDPGLHDTGWALVTEDSILAAGFLSTPKRVTGKAAVAMQLDQFSTALWDLGPVPRAVVETMHFKDRSKSPDSMLDLSLLAGGLYVHCQSTVKTVEFLPATEWTKGIDKEVRANRVLDVYYSTDLKAIASMAGCTPTQATHVVDAIGMARYRLTRDKKRRRGVR